MSYNIFQRRHGRVFLTTQKNNNKVIEFTKGQESSHTFYTYMHTYRYMHMLYMYIHIYIIYIYSILYSIS